MTGFVFDLDGTLADSIPYIIKTARMSFRALGAEVDDERLMHFLGIPLLKAGEEVLGKERGHEYLEEYQRHYTDDHFMPPPFPGVPEMLKTLYEAGAKMAACTSKLEEPALGTVKSIGAEPYFKAVVHCQSGYGTKPSPGPSEAAAKLLGEAPADCFFIGDSVHDIRSGKGAGMTAIGVTWGSASREQLIAAGADVLCDTMELLTELLLNKI